MQKGLKQAIIFLSGAGIGSLVTWFSVKEKYRIQCEERIAENREAFRKRLDEIYESSSKKAKASINKPDIKNIGIEPEHDKISSIKSYESIIKTIDNSTNKIDYTKFFPKDDSDNIKTDLNLNDIDISENNIESNDTIEENNDEWLIEITREDYMYSNDYDHLTLTLYSDNVVADELEQEIDNFDTLIGDNPYSYFTSNKDTVFLRNHNRQADIELIKDDRSYIEAKEDYM